MLHTLLGPDVYAKDARIRQLASGRVVRLNGGDGAEPWYAAVGQADLFGESVAVIGSELLGGLGAAERKRLAEHLEQSGCLQSDQVVIVVDTEPDLNKRDGKPFKDGLAQFLMKGKVEVFARPSQGQVVKWLSDEIVARKVKISKPELVELAERFEGNRLALSQELDKLVLYRQAKDKNQAESRGSIDEIVVGVGQVGDVFGLTDAWAERKIEMAMSQLERLLEQESWPMLMAMLERQARLVYLARLGQESGMRSQELGSALGVAPFVAAKAAGAARKWSVEQLQMALDGLFKLDLGIKSGDIGAEIGLELWVAESLGS